MQQNNAHDRVTDMIRSYNTKFHAVADGLACDAVLHGRRPSTPLTRGSRMLLGKSWGKEIIKTVATRYHNTLGSQRGRMLRRLASHDGSACDIFSLTDGPHQ